MFDAHLQDDLSNVDRLMIEIAVDLDVVAGLKILCIHQTAVERSNAKPFCRDDVVRLPVDMNCHRIAIDADIADLTDDDDRISETCPVLSTAIPICGQGDDREEQPCDEE